MKIGMTYDLRSEYLKMGYSEEETAEFDKEDTIQSIEHILQDSGFQTNRIGNVRCLIERLAKGERWDLVFNIAEGVQGFGREAQVPAVLEAYNIPYTFSDPLVLSIALHKGMTKRVIRSLGIPTADFFEVSKEADIENISMPFPLFAKPIAEGTSKGITKRSKIETPDDLLTVCRDLLESYRQPILVEPFLPGREFTVGMIGSGEAAYPIGTIEVMLNESAEKGAYTYWNKQHYEGLVEYRLATDPLAINAQEIALSAWRGLGCRDAGRVDLRADEKGKLQFIELNPLPGLRPIHSDLPILCSKTGMSYGDLIHHIITSALKRVHPIKWQENIESHPITAMCAT